MPDLMKTPSNRRYVVNFQHKEPINKYDIWLSFNKHEQGNQIIVDSEYLADKDLVFKIYMNGKWRPILGIPVSYEGIIQALEELDKKKMNIVPNFVDGHIPVFQQGSDECDQLIDGGTIEELVSNALTTIINGGGAIPLQRATATQLGGVKAGLHIHNNNPDQYVEAKFKFPEGYNEGGIVENDRLYISASEIIQAINTYIGGGGSGLDLQLMGPSTRGGARANYVPVTWDAAHYIPVLVRTVDEMLYVNIDGIIEKIVALLESGDIEIYEAGDGIDITNNVISIDTSHATTDYVLGYNGTNVEWVPQRVNTYSASYGINIDSQLNVISGDITDNSSNVYVATSDVLLRALSAGGTARRAVILRLDGSQNATSLYPYNYYEVEFALDGPGTLTIEIDDQLELMDGNPVYVLLTLTGKTNGIAVSVSETSRPRTININNAIVNGELNLNYTHFLITMQFGIARIEPLENVTVNNNNENEEE